MESFSKNGDFVRVALAERIQSMQVELDLFKHGYQVASDHVAQLTDQVKALQSQVRHWQSNHDNMVRKAAFLSERPDLPVDRLPAYRELVASRAALQDIADCYDFRSELYTSDADCAGTLADKARAALAKQERVR